MTTNWLSSANSYSWPQLHVAKTTNDQGWLTSWPQVATIWQMTTNWLTYRTTNDQGWLTSWPQVATIWQMTTNWLTYRTTNDQGWLTSWPQVATIDKWPLIVWLQMATNLLQAITNWLATTSWLQMTTGEHKLINYKLTYNDLKYSISADWPQITTYQNDWLSSFNHTDLNLP